MARAMPYKLKQHNGALSGSPLLMKKTMILSVFAFLFVLEVIDASKT